MANMMADLMAGEANPNTPDEKQVRLQLIKQLQMSRQELEDENAELRCASRELNARLVKQAIDLDTEKRRCEALEGLVMRARNVLKIAHLRVFKSHKRNFHPLTMADPPAPACPVCMVILETERSAR